MMTEVLGSGWIRLLCPHVDGMLGDVGLRFVSGASSSRAYLAHRGLGTYSRREGKLRSSIVTSPELTCASCPWQQSSWWRLNNATMIRKHAASQAGAAKYFLLGGLCAEPPSQIFTSFVGFPHWSAR